MFGLGLPEIIVIFVIALLVFGPKKLPDIGKSIGRAMAEFKKASDDFQESVRSEMKEVEKSTGVEEIKKLGSIDISPSMKEVEKFAGIEEIKKLSSVDVSTSEQTGSATPASEQGTAKKPRKKKTGEAKRNV